MAYKNRTSYLCYNNSDLIRDGIIRPTITKGYDPVSTFRESRLKKPAKGVRFVVERDKNTNKIISVKEIKKQLPASKIRIDIDFSKVMRSAVTHPISPGSTAFTPMMGLLGNFGLPALGFGGITSGLSYFTMQILDSETRINRRIIVTKDMVSTGIWECDEGFPLSVFGVVKNHFIEPKDKKDKGSFTNGLAFTKEQISKIGKYSDGSWKGSPRKRISGATDSNGLFGQIGIPEVKFEKVAFPDQEQIFERIVKDGRKLKFRGDNYDTTISRDAPTKLSGTDGVDAPFGSGYPPTLSGKDGIDATDRRIKLKKELLKEGEELFITYCVATERRVRQNLRHRGDIAQGNTIGIIGFVGAIKSEVDAFDHQIKTWMVPAGNSAQDLDTSNNDSLPSSYYKLTLTNYLKIKDLEASIDKLEESITDSNRDAITKQIEAIKKQIDKASDTIEGWRLSESITTGETKKFWAADYRGILLFNDNSDTKVKVIYPSSSIRDKEWFREYLESLDFVYPTGGKDDDKNDIYLTVDLQKKIEDNIKLDNQPGFLFDLSDITNSLFFDKEKIPYYRPFANALKSINKYNKDNKASGIGIQLLDILNVDGGSGASLESYDLSFVEFDHVNAQPQKRYSCDEPFDIRAYHYWSESYDGSTLTGGQGAWYDGDVLDTDLWQWQPSGGSIESYWHLETPYFCIDSSRKTRIYTENQSGPSLDNYSWIYTDTEPFTPQNISSDSHAKFDESILTFNDDNMHYGLCYHKLCDSQFDQQQANIKVDYSLSHVKEPYDHKKDFMVGQNRIMGDSPSFAYGNPITDEITRICEDDYGDSFWFSKDIYGGEEDDKYKLNFKADIPKAGIPSDWYIKRIYIKFDQSIFNTIKDYDKYISFYFEGSESSVSNIKVQRPLPGDQYGEIVLDLKYYYNGPLQFLGEFWKKLTIISVSLRYTTVNDSRNTKLVTLDDYKIKSGQNAVIYDGSGKLMVFYADNENANISVAISYDDGCEWIIHKNLIRLVSGESAGMPYVIKDRMDHYVHLFFTLNDIFLMYKRIDTDLFEYSDAFVEYEVPATYNVNDYDQTKKDPEGEYWGYYTDNGRFLRRFPSYFISGDSNDPYFIEQMRIKNDLIDDYESSPATDVQQFPRFDFSGELSEMADSFRSDSYRVYSDDEGVLRLFMISDGKLTVKRSNDYFSWKYDIKEQIIHKNFVNEQVNKGFSEDIQNIQVIRNDYTAGFTSVLYFNNGMLFLRHFQTDLLFPFYGSDGKMNNDAMKEHLSLTVDEKTKQKTNHRPIFLVGKLPDDIKNTLIKEFNKGTSYTESDLFIHFPYTKDMIEKFDDRFGVDSDTQPYGFTTKDGLIRVFYMDSFGYLESIIINGYYMPNLEVMNKFNHEVSN